MKFNIPKPSEDQIKEDHNRLYRDFHMQSVAVEAGTSAKRYSKQRSVEAELTRNPVWEVMMEMRAAKVTNQEEIGKGVFKMLFDYASELGLVDEQPLDIIKLATQRLRRIGPEEIKAMSANERTIVVAEAVALEEEAGRVKIDVNEARMIVEDQPHGYEFSGSGSIAAVGKR